MSNRFFKPECLYGTPDGHEEADCFDLLADVAIIDILSRLPIQQLLRCNQVCRRWHSLLGTPDFAQEHEKRHHTSHVPLVYRRGRKQEDERELFLLRDQEARERGKKPLQIVRLSGELKGKISWPRCGLLGTYNGLLLFEGDPHDSTYCLLNPLTREAVTFKNPDRVCGLYFYPPKRQYRLLCYREITDNLFLYYVCSTTGQQLLKEVGTFEFKPDRSSVGIDFPAVAVNGGLLYWLAYRQWKSDRNIMMFDVVSETLQLRPYPKGPAENDQAKLKEHWTSRLFEMGERLYMYLSNETGMEVWVLEESTDWRWAKTFTYCMDPRDYRGAYYCRLPLTIEDGELVFLQPLWGLFRTSLSANRLRCVGDRRKKDFFLYGCMVNWRRSLISFKDYL